MGQFTLNKDNAHFLGTAFPQRLKINGTNFPLSVLRYPVSVIRSSFWALPAENYSSNPNVRIYWYADNATSGVVRWDVAIAAITGNVDTGDVETKAFAAVTAGDDTHLGSGAQRLHFIDIVPANLDSLAAADAAVMRIRREGTHANDTMANGANFWFALLTWTDA